LDFPQNQIMSVLNQSGEEPVECPLCMEQLEVDDLNFHPCTCGYQVNARKCSDLLRFFCAVSRETVEIVLKTL
jgi:hypothetical protein